MPPAALLGDVPVMLVLVLVPNDVGVALAPP